MIVASAGVAEIRTASAASDRCAAVTSGAAIATTASGSANQTADGRRAARAGSFRIRVTRRTSGESLRAIVLAPAASPSLAGEAHDATIERQRASARGERVCCTAHWSHRNSADSQSFARATRFSGWKKNARSSAPTRMRHAGSRRITCAISCASAARWCSASSCSQKSLRQHDLPTWQAQEGPHTSCSW